VEEGADGFLQYAVDGERKPAAKIYLEKIKYRTDQKYQL
jgi:hypothetical protein